MNCAQEVANPCRVPLDTARFCSVCRVRDRSVCADMPAEELTRVEKIMAHRNVPKGRAVMSEGEPNDSLFIVTGGSFCLSKHLEDGRRQVTGFLFQGDFFGVRPCMECAYTAEALEDSVVCRFPHNYLDEISGEFPGIKDRLIARAQTEYHKAQDHIVLLGVQSAEERVLSFLKMIAAAIGSKLDDGAVEIPLPMSRQDIADYLGLRHETLSRALTALKEKSILRDVGRRAVILAGA